MKSGIRPIEQATNELLQLRQHTAEFEARGKQGQPEEILKIFAYNSPIGIYIIQNGVIKLANKELCRLSGYSLGELVGIDPFHLALPEDKSVIKEMSASILKGRRYSPFEHKFVKKNGEIGWVVETYTHIQYQGAQAILGYFMDTTERRQSEEALIKVEKRFRDLAESTSDIVWEVDADLKFTYVNKKVRETYGYEVDEILGKSMPFTLAPHEVKRFSRYVNRMAKLRRPIRRFETMNIHKDGRMIAMESSAVCIIGEEGQFLGYLGVDHDVSERKRLQDNIQFYVSQMTNAQEEERKRIARELHDGITQDLAGLCIYIDEISLMEKQLYDSLPRDMERLHTRIKNIVDETRRICQRLRPQLLDRFGLMPSLVTLAEELQTEGNIVCHIETAGSERRISPESELSLFRVAQESLHNIRKHSDATETAICVEFGRKKVKLRITDNGKGFILPKTLSDFAPTGKFGLMGMEERVRSLGGSLRIRTAKDKGTTISLEVPVRPLPISTPGY